MIDINEKSSYIDDIKLLFKNLHFKTIIILINISIIFIFQYYWGIKDLTHKFFKNLVPNDQLEIFESVSWCGLIFLFYFCIPFIVIKLIFKEKISNYGLSFKGLKKHWFPYLVLYLLVFPVIIIAAQNPYFKEMYPFYKYVSKSLLGFIIWEISYGFQFLAVEFLFRGYILFGLKEKFGVYSLFIMVVPYCMIHFAKPMGEAFGAIFAGIILGYLALKNRSIFGGVFLHWIVAVTMDLASILQN